MNLIHQNHFANIFTMFNLFSWIIWIILIFREHYLVWIIVFLLWQIFDLFDWKLARKFWSTKNWALYDDIADFTSFWILPWLSIIATIWLNKYSIFFASFYIFCVWYRLWRFIKYDKKNKKIKAWVFSWLPSPAWAIIVLSFTLLEANILLTYFVVFISWALMISKIQFAHFWNIILKKLDKKIISFFSILSTTIVLLSVIFKSLDLFLYYIFWLWIIYIIFWRIYIKTKNN